MTDKTMNRYLDISNELLVRKYLDISKSLSDIFPDQKTEEERILKYVLYSSAIIIKMMKYKVDNNGQFFLEITDFLIKKILNDSASFSFIDEKDKEVMEVWSKNLLFNNEYTFRIIRLLRKRGFVVNLANDEKEPGRYKLSIRLDF